MDVILDSERDERHARCPITILPGMWHVVGTNLPARFKPQRKRSVMPLV